MNPFQEKPSRRWTVFIAECADGSYYSDFTFDLKRRICEINNQEGVYFSHHPERLPIKIIYKETDLTFEEAFFKSKHLAKMNRRLKKKLISTGKWPKFRIPALRKLFDRLFSN